MSYENKMMQLKQMLGKTVDKQSEKPMFKKPDKPEYLHRWEKAGLAIVENDFGVLFKREVEYPMDYVHGDFPLSMFFDALSKWQGTNIEHPYSIGYDEQVVFFDTETTGLKGVGTNIFLIGLLEAQSDAFVLTQYVLADPANEAAFLFESKFWQQKKTVITYNGKSFDWPQLETRWTLNQHLLPKLKTHRQIDLLHSSKRIWKNNLERMKLTQVEEEKLGFKRSGDIPGFLAPIIYTDAVKSGNPESLMKVLFHNEWDLLSLISLYIHSTNLLLEGKTDEAATTYTNIGKWFGDLKHTQQSDNVLLNVTKSFNDEEAGLAYYYLAINQKRNKQFEHAANSFEKAIPHINNREKLKAFEQLAIIYEHYDCQYDKALAYTMEGIEYISTSHFFKKEQQQKKIAEWTKRLKRIESKLQRK
ncbi:ribonuclease H-like domain-containing protein [Lysinibacillus sp. BW-2-10]|uniref:ribonuclease H-like domain-containing protein n=1 Tax=Lysinibacillus sp. BW-2-10 TaxID=2590030 RepID=UPI00117C9238|nr:ribonuclease H-like domain-containing protein [Lysinibacillus sp. BW-2-10]TSI09075.1 exonuclease [Lysinibacillus sp. BW-2-10]